MDEHTIFRYTQLVTTGQLGRVWLEKVNDNLGNPVHSRFFAAPSNLPFNALLWCKLCAHAGGEVDVLDAVAETNKHFGIVMNPVSIPSES